MRDRFKAWDRVKDRSCTFRSRNCALVGGYKCGRVLYEACLHLGAWAGAHSRCTLGSSCAGLLLDPEVADMPCKFLAGKVRFVHGGAGRAVAKLQWKGIVVLCRIVFSRVARLGLWVGVGFS